MSPEAEKARAKVWGFSSGAYVRHIEGGSDWDIMIPGYYHKMIAFGSSEDEAWINAAAWVTRAENL